MSKARTLANTVSTGGSLETPDAIPASDISGLSTVATSGSYNDLSNKPTTIATADDLSGGVTGAIPYQANVGDTSMLSPGTSGQVLTSGGSGAAPSWATPAGGGLVYLSTVTASGATTVNIESTFDSTYDNYVIFASNVQVGTATASLRCYPKLGGTYTPTSDWKEHGSTAIFTSVTAYRQTSASGVGAYVDVIGTLDSADNNRRLEFVMEVMGPVSSSTVGKGIIYRGTYRTSSTDGASFVGGCMFATNNFDCAALTGIRFQASTGTISGTFRLYGIKNS